MHMHPAPRGLKNETHLKNEQKVGMLLQKITYTRRQKKVPPFDPYNGRPFKKNGRRTGIERELNGR